MRPPRRRRGRAPVGLDRSRGSRGLPESRSRRGGGVGEPDVEGSASTISTPVPPPVSLVPPTRLPPVPSETTHDTGISDATRSASANAATPFHRPLRSTRSLRSAWSSRSASRSVPITHACSRPAKLSVTKRARRGSRPAAPKPLGSTAAGSGVRTSCEHRRVGYFCPDFHSRRLYIVTATAGRQCNRYLFREEVNN